MKKFILIVWLLFLAIPSHATLIQDKCTGSPTTEGCAASPCTLSGLTSTGAGHLIVATLVADSASNSTLSSLTNETFTVSAASRIQNATGTTQAAYVLSSTGGWTSTAMTITGSTGTWNFCISEFSTSSTGLDTGASSGVCTNSVATAAPVSCNLTVSGAVLDIVSSGVWGGSITGSSNYTNVIGPNGNAGVGVNVGTTSGTGATWTPTTSNSGGFLSIAFKETASSSVVAGWKSPTVGPSYAISMILGFFLAGGFLYGIRQECSVGSDWSMARNIHSAETQSLPRKMLAMDDESVSVVPGEPARIEED